MFAALTTRLWYLQVLASQTYVDIANTTSFRLARSVEPERGRILDAHGDPLVDNRESRVVTVQQQRLGDGAARPCSSASRSASGSRGGHRAARSRTSSTTTTSECRSRSTWRGEHLLHRRAREGVPRGEVGRADRAPVPAGVARRARPGPGGPDRTASRWMTPRSRTTGRTTRSARPAWRRRYERFLHGTAGTQKIVVNPAGKLLDELGGQLPVPGYDVKLYLDARCRRGRAGPVAGIERARTIFDETRERREELRGQRRRRRW